jgi:VRR-NUC domain
MMREVAPITEKDFLQQVIDLARLCGWKVYHTFDARRSAPGYPDLTLVHPARGDFFLAELKSATGRLSPAQATWLDALRRAGIECYLWRPSDFNAIVSRLSHEQAGEQARVR